MKSILILFHVKSNTGYAIGRLEPIFYRMALQLCDGDKSRIHIAYTSMADGKPTTLPSDFDQYAIFDASSDSDTHCEELQAYIRKHSIDVVFGFDQPVRRKSYRFLRAAGVKCFVSYWGAPMSSIFGPLKRALKRIDVLLSRDGPDHYIFESQGMADTAVLGRGIPLKRVHVAYLSVDTDKFRPESNRSTHAHEVFSIPSDRRIFFFSGHMEPRKGVATIVRAANFLARERAAKDWHVLLLGNKGNEAQYLIDMLEPDAAQHVTFGGYRSDIEFLHRSCYAGIIASTGWDSLTCSSLEMQSSGLPLLLSDLLGLREAIEDGVSGLLFPPGDHHALANRIAALLDDEGLQRRLSQGARHRAKTLFSETIQLEKLTSIVRVAYAA